MKVLSIDLDDTELPNAITVTMTRDEAVVLARMTGGHSIRTASAQFGDRGKCTESIYDALVGAVFNRFWEDGVDDAARLPTIAP